ncbi:hypothetical protein [Anatilimnocola aggregata]|nr:hypothetical protein [Anatilimnocola aggregata]
MLLSVGWTTRAVGQAIPSAPPPLKLVAPADAGFEAEKLPGVEKIVAAGLAAKKMPGCVVAFGSRGKLAWL